MESITNSEGDRAAPSSRGAAETRREFLIRVGTTAGVLGLACASNDAWAAEAGAEAGAEKSAEKPAPKPAEPSGALPAPIPVPDWVHGVTRMSFLSPAEAPKAAKMGVQVVHTNVVWPYYPLRRDGGGLSRDDAAKLKALVDDCRRGGMRLVLGLPPFPSVAAVKAHPDWRVHPDDSDAARKVVPLEDNLGTRVPCNLGPWGDYLIELCGELVEDFGVDGYSYDGNYHAALCFCPACKAAYRRDNRRELPPKADLDDVAYRQYLAWRGDRLIEYYVRLQKRIKRARADAVLMSWTVNAGRYGHFLYSPRAMPTRLNQVFDLPMQEWWLDETNVGASVVPTFGATYLRATTGDRPAAAEPYLMSRGNPYGTDSFPAHERRTRCLLALACGNVLAESLGWPGHDVADDFREVAKLEKYLTRTAPLPWAAMLVSEQTRQFYAYKDIAERFLPNPLGAFRAAMEEHLPLSLVNDWDVTAATLSRYAVVVLPNAAALSDAQAAAIRQYVQAGGGVVATGETSLCDELGRPRRDFALADLFGVSYRGRPSTSRERPQLDENFARSLDEAYWNQRIGVATLRWGEHPLLDDPRLKELVPNGSARFRGPLVQVSEPAKQDEVVVRLQAEGVQGAPMPGAILRNVGKGRVAYFAAMVDAALWSYAYPYQRRLFVRAIEWAARQPTPISVRAPMCVLATYFTQSYKPPGEGGKERRRTILHFFNGINTTANHGLPSAEVPLREEIVPIHGIEVTFHRGAPKTFLCEPGQKAVESRRVGEKTIVVLPPLDTHFVLVGED